MDESGLADGNYLGYRVRVRLVPEGNEEYREVTHRLADAGRLLGIPLLDSVFIGRGRNHSMKD